MPVQGMPPFLSFAFGAALALALIAVLRILRARRGKQAQVWAVALTLVAIAAVYPVRAYLTAADDSSLLHVVAAAGFALLALLGAALAPLLLAFGLLLHAGFDFALDISLTARGLVPHYYPPLCLAFDTTLGLWWIWAVFKDRNT